MSEKILFYHSQTKFRESNVIPFTVGCLPLCSERRTSGSREDVPRCPGGAFGSGDVHLWTHPQDSQSLGTHTPIPQQAGGTHPTEMLYFYVLSSEILDVIPLSFGCPMTTIRKGRRYLATVARGSDTILRGDRSDVKLEINKGCPKRAYLMEVRTDLSNFGSIIPDDECFISPIVEVLAPAETSTSSYTLRIPHCLDEGDDRTKVKVRLVQENRNPAVVEVPKGNAGALYYDIDARFTELHTTHFTKVICTICQTPYHCRGRIDNFWFANFYTEQLKSTTFLHEVEIRPYFGGVIHAIADFRKVINQIFYDCFKNYIYQIF